MPSWCYERQAPSSRYGSFVTLQVVGANAVCLLVQFRAVLAIRLSPTFGPTPEVCRQFHRRRPMSDQQRLDSRIAAAAACGDAVACLLGLLRALGQYRVRLIETGVTAPVLPTVQRTGSEYTPISRASFESPLPAYRSRF